MHCCSSRVYRCCKKETSIGARHRYSKVQTQSNRSKKGTLARCNSLSGLNIHFGNVTLTLCAICSPVAHGSSVHWLFHVWLLIVRVTWTRLHRSCASCQATGHMTLIECGRERPLVTSRSHRRKARCRVVVHCVVRVRGIGVGGHSAGRHCVHWRVVRRRDGFELFGTNRWLQRLQGWQRVTVLWVHCAWTRDRGGAKWLLHGRLRLAHGLGALLIWVYRAVW